MLRALAKDPARRFADADEFIAALQQARAALPISAGTAFAGAIAGTALATGEPYARAAGHGTGRGRAVPGVRRAAAAAGRRARR